MTRLRATRSKTAFADVCTTRKKAKFYRYFFNVAHLRRFRCAGAGISAIGQRNRVADDDETRIAHASIHTSLSGSLLFSLCCSKWNAVRFDSRTHLCDTRHIDMARRAAMAKRKKAKAVKTAKKKKGRKKRL